MSLHESVVWNADGLAPAVAIDHKTGAFLMLAWMNREALDATVRRGRATFYSRSRGTLWEKGETSGNTLQLIELRLDCDGDTIVLEVEPAGPACHTGKPSCAFRRAEGNSWQTDDGPRGAPAAILEALFATCIRRKDATSRESYTKSLFDGGASAIIAKIAEEQVELCDELESGNQAALVHEVADLLFHVIVGLAHRDIEPAKVWEELARRTGQSGHEEKRRRKDPA